MNPCIRPMYAKFQRIPSPSRVCVHLQCIMYAKLLLIYHVTSLSMNQLMNNQLIKPIDNLSKPRKTYKNLGNTYKHLGKTYKHLGKTFTNLKNTYNNLGNTLDQPRVQHLLGVLVALLMPSTYHWIALAPHEVESRFSIENL